MAYALTPGEAMVLLDPNGATGREAAKVSIMALLAERKLVIDKISEKKTFGGQRIVEKMRAVASPAGQPAHVASLLSLIRGVQPAAVPDVVKAARKEYGADLGGFAKKFVGPSLVARGLLKETVEPFLLFFKRKRLAHTPAGAMEKSRLEALMAQARDIPRFLDSDPAKAAAIAVALGGLVLLAPELRSYLGQIGDAMKVAPPPANSSSDSSSGESGYSYSSSSSTSESSAPLEPFAPGATETLGAASFDWSSFDSASFETMSESMDSFDSGFDSASSDSGGGGGDSGGGGDGGGGGD
jgi:hypothetical protein